MKHLLKKTGRLLFAVFVAAALCGCGRYFDMEGTPGNQRADILTAPANEDLIVVGVSQMGSESVWRTAHTNSIQTTFTRDKGYFLIFNNARQKQENQIKAVRSFISQQVDYIILSPITEDGWDTVLQEAKDAGIPVILTDRRVNVCDSSLYTTWVGSNFLEEGKKAGVWLEEYLQEIGQEQKPVNLVVLRGTEGSTSMMGRTAGFEYITRHHENWCILESVNAEYTTAKGREEMKKLLQKYNDINVVVAQNDDMAFGALEAIYDAGKTVGENGDMLVLSFDGTRDALKMVQSGAISVDVECNPDQGPYLSMIINKLENDAAVQRAYYVPEQVFTTENVGDFIEERNY